MFIVGLVNVIIVVRTEAYNIHKNLNREGKCLKINVLILLLFIACVCGNFFSTFCNEILMKIKFTTSIK